MVARAGGPHVLRRHLLDQFLPQDARRRGRGQDDEVRAIDDVLGKLTASYMIASVSPDESQAVRPDHQLMHATEIELMRQAMSELPERERKVIREFYFEGRVLDDIAKDLGISKSWTSRIHTKALSLVRERMEKG